MVLKRLFVLGLILVFFSFVQGCDNEAPRNEDGSVNGALVFKSNCISCHGESGDAGIAGAKDLTISSLSEDETKQIISYGSKNGGMMGYKDFLSEDEIEALVAHVKSLKK